MALFRCDTPCQFRLTFFEKGRQLECDEEDVNNIPWPFTRIDAPDTRPDSVRLKPKPPEKVKEVAPDVAQKDALIADLLAKLAEKEKPPEIEPKDLMQRIRDAGGEPKGPYTVSNLQKQLDALATQ